MNPIEQILTKQTVMILDGAMGTELENHGCNLHDNLWSAKVLAENPQIIKRVHLDYFIAGADCAITASYQATLDGYIQRGFTKNEAIKLIKKAVEIAIEARDEFWQALENKENRLKPLVAASVGPYGAFLADGSEYRGDYTITEEQLTNFHRDRIKILLEAGADILACETIPCLLEAKVITNILKEFPEAYAWISFSAKDGDTISNGESIADCAKWLNNHNQIAAIGVNCTAPEYISSLIQNLKKHTSKPILIYPNSGEEYDAEQKKWSENESNSTFGHLSKEWFDEGATIIGGCCRTNPKDIQAITNWAKKLV